MLALQYFYSSIKDFHAHASFRRGNWTWFNHRPVDKKESFQRSFCVCVCFFWHWLWSGSARRSRRSFSHFRHCVTRRGGQLSLVWPIGLKSWWGTAHCSIMTRSALQLPCPAIAGALASRTHGLVARKNLDAWVETPVVPGIDKDTRTLHHTTFKIAIHLNEMSFE